VVAALLISALLHGAVLGWLGQAAPASRASGSAMSAGFQVHALPPPEPHSGQPAAPSPDRPGAGATLISSADKDVQPATPNRVGPPASAGITAYWPADALTQKPIFQYYRQPPQSELLPDVNPAPVVADLLISERGDVDRVQLHENVLSVAAQAFISETLQAMHFSPGRIGARSVKSSISLEVDLRDFAPAGQAGLTP